MALRLFCQRPIVHSSLASLASSSVVFKSPIHHKAPAFRSSIRLSPSSSFLFSTPLPALTTAAITRPTPQPRTYSFFHSSSSNQQSIDNNNSTEPSIQPTQDNTPFISEDLSEQTAARVKVDGKLVDVSSFSQEIVEEVAKDTTWHWYDVPINLVQDLLQSVHDDLGLQWWSTIALVTTAMRLLVFPVSVYSQKNSQKMRLIQPQIQQLQEEMKKQGQMNSRMAQMEYRKRMTAIMEKNDVSLFRTFLGPFLQLPFFLAFFLALKRMATTVPSFQEGGLWWFIDLSVPDLSLVRLPIIAAFSTLLTFELSFRNAATPTPGYLKNFFRLFCFSFIPLTMSMPQAIHLYWTYSSWLSLLQTTVLRSPKFQAWVKIPVVPVTQQAPNQIRFAYDPSKLGRRAKKTKTEGEIKDIS